jgi:hypothetical protein
MSIPGDHQIAEQIQHVHERRLMSERWGII